MIVNDHILYCYDCGMDKTNPCKQHKLKWVLNKAIDCKYTKYRPAPQFKKYTSKNNIIKCSCFRNGVKHIENTLPECLLFKTSLLYINDIGVFTLELIARGTMFGPFLGKLTIINSVKSDVFESSINGKAWLIHKNEENKNDIIVDAGNPFLSNWMRYVSCSIDARKQNLLAIQYDGMIFYRACEHEADLELLKGRKLKRPRFMMVPNQVTADIDQDTNITYPKSPKIPKINFPTLRKDLTINIPSSVVHYPKMAQCAFPRFYRPTRFYQQFPIERKNHNIAINLFNHRHLLPWTSNNINRTEIKQPKSNKTKSMENVNIQELPGQVKTLCEPVVHKFPSFDSGNAKIDTTASIRQMSQLLSSFPRKNSLSFKKPKDGCSEELLGTHNTPSSPKLLYKNIEPSQSEAHFKCSTIDNQCASFMSHILKFEPYLSIENIIGCVKERFPLRLTCKRLEVLNLLKSKKIREQSNLWIDVDEDIISGVVGLFKKNPEWTFEMIQLEVTKMFASYPTASVTTIEDIVRSNFSERKVNCIKREIIQFIYRLIRQRMDITIPEINIILRDNFPDSKIISNIVIDGILNDSAKRGTSSDSVDKEVRKMVKEIHKECNLLSRFK